MWCSGSQIPFTPGEKNGGAKAASSGLPFLSVESRVAEQDSSPRPEAARSGGDLEEKAKKKKNASNSREKNKKQESRDRKAGARVTHVFRD
jgi:hypothetical protein